MYATNYDRCDLMTCFFLDLCERFRMTENKDTLRMQEDFNETSMEDFWKSFHNFWRSMRLG